MTYDPSKLFFTDCETTGLDPNRHDAWEIAWIEYDAKNNLWEENVRHLWPPALQDAEPIALSINQFYERTQPVQVGSWDDPRYVAEEIAYATAGKHIVGACPWFDVGFYTKLLNNNGFTPAWHYHLIDVEALGIGHLAATSGAIELGRHRQPNLELPLPWKSDWLAKELGLERPEAKERHTALGDTREVKATFEHIMGTWDGSPPTP